MNHLSGKLSFLAVLLYLTGCTKANSSSNQNASAGIAGKWGLVNDSTFEGVGYSNHPVVYVGQAGDYFNFSANGDVYTKEANLLDTLIYKTVSDTSILLSGFGVILNGIPDTCKIKGLTANIGLMITSQIITIESHRVFTPGGEFWRKVTLSR